MEEERFVDAEEKQGSRIREELDASGFSFSNLDTV